MRVAEPSYATTFRLVERGGISFFRSDLLSLSPQVQHGFFAKGGGKGLGMYASLNTSLGVGDDREVVLQNRIAALGALGLDNCRLVTPECSHTANVAVLEDLDSDEILMEGVDGVVTQLEGAAILVSTADCFPVIFYAPDVNAYGLSHAGWRGLQAGIISNTIKALSKEFHADPQKLHIVVGPGIGACCYIVPNPIQRNLPNWRNFLKPLDGSFVSIDLRGFLSAQLLDGDVLRKNMDYFPGCNSCDSERFFSYRREGQRSGRFPTIVGKPRGR